MKTKNQLMQSFTKTILFLAILIQPFFGFTTSFEKIYEKILTNKLSYYYFESMINDEYYDLFKTGDYKHLLHVKYLKYEQKHYLQKKQNTTNEIILLYNLKKEVKFIDHNLYIFLEKNYISYIQNLSEKKNKTKELINYCFKYNVKKELFNLYLILSDTEFKQKKLFTAIKNWKISLKYADEKNNIEKSSVYNNIACSYEELKDYNNAIRYNSKARNELELIQDKRIDYKYFYLFLLGNRAIYAMHFGDYKLAYKYFKENYDFYLKHPDFNHLLAEPARELLRINKYLNKPSKELILNVEKGYSKLKKPEYEKSFLRFLIEYYQEVKNLNKTLFYSNKLLKIINLEQNKKIKEILLINNQLNKDQIEKTKNEQKLKFEIEQRNNLLFMISLILLLILFIVFLSFRLKIINQNKKIAQNKIEIEMSKKENLEKEFLLKSQFASNLELSLNVKKKSEEVFMQKLKELKRKKNNDPDEIINELQLQIMNLFQIDKKQSSKNSRESKNDISFIEKMRSLHSELSEQELRLCSYFRMNLSSKEISQLEQQLAVNSIKVIKNRIKKKLELEPDVKLDDYLNGLC